MKLKELKPILRSVTGRFQPTIIYDLSTCEDIIAGCSVEYAVEHYGDLEVVRLEACGDDLVINVGKEN